MSSPDGACPFCERIARGDAVLESELAAAIPDAFPVSPGHTLVVPRRHEPDFFSLTHEEQGALLELARRVCDALLKQDEPDGFNIGLNAGSAAGQTVGHTHVHVIPRFHGDTADPRGGVRWVLPDRAAYWATEDPA